MSPRVPQYCPPTPTSSNHAVKSAPCALSKAGNLALSDARQSKTSHRGKHALRDHQRHRSKENRPQPPPVRVFDPANVYAKTTPTMRKASAVRRADPASDRPVLRARLLPNRTRHLDRGPLAANRRKVFEVPVAAVSNEPTHIFKVSSVLKLLPAWEPCSNSE
ncbi:hypothetical protein AAHC03_0578 [Spirometra sp. Aus1]